MWFFFIYNVPKFYGFDSGLVVYTKTKLLMKGDILSRIVNGHIVIQCLFVSFYDGWSTVLQRQGVPSWTIMLLFGMNFETLSNFILVLFLLGRCVQYQVLGFGAYSIYQLLPLNVLTVNELLVLRFFSSGLWIASGTRLYILPFFAKWAYMHWLLLKHSKRGKLKLLILLFWV